MREVSPEEARARASGLLTLHKSLVPDPAHLMGLIMGFLCCGVWLGCTRSGFAVEPYRSQPEAALLLSAEAEAQCLELRDELPDHAFSSDGCSIFFDGSWLGCCIEHDKAYWCGGSAKERKRADREFRECIAGADHAARGWTMEKGVRMGGVPWLPFSWRWGYGWKDWPRGYEPDVTRPEAGESGPSGNQGSGDQEN